MKDLLRHYETKNCADSYLKFTEKEKDLNRVFYDAQSGVDTALCGKM